MLYHCVMKFIFQIHNSQARLYKEKSGSKATAQLVLACDEDKVLSSMGKRKNGTEKER
jgi:hypothetical protein